MGELEAAASCAAGGKMMIDRRSFLVGAAAASIAPPRALANPPGAGTIASREVLTSTRHLFVDPKDGRDDYDGRTSATAFNTIQQAYDVCAGLDLNSRDVRIKLADGVYRKKVRVVNGPIGSGNIVLVGNRADPSKVLLDCVDGNALAFACPSRTYSLEGLRVQTRERGENCLVVHRSSYVYLKDMDFGPCLASHIITQEFSQILVHAGYTISGGAEQHWYATNQGLIICVGFAITLTNAPKFRYAFAVADRMGGLNVVGNTFRGEATGRRYQVGPTPSWITSGATTLPGDVDGVALGQGVYT